MPRRRAAVRPEPPIDPWHDVNDPARRDPPGCRVALDVRPLQEPDKSPITAAYLRHLLEAYAAEPLAGETFAVLLQAGLPDPTASIPGLPVVSRRILPPTRRMRSGALTLDPFLLRGASIGLSRGAGSPAVYHVAGAGLPLASRLPTVATLLDLAPWEIPDVYQASPAARFGERLRAQMLRDAAAVIVGTETAATAASRLLHLRREHVHVVPLAPDPALVAASGGTPTAPVTTDTAALIDAESGEAGGIRPREIPLDLPARYVALFARYDARADLHTLFDAIALLGDGERPADLDAAVPWPPTVLLIGASPDDRASLARAAARRGVEHALSYAPYVAPATLGSVIAGARAVVVPAVSDAAGLHVIDSLAVGAPVIGSAVGAIPELVGSAGILVEAGNPARLARAIEAIWTDDATEERLRDDAAKRAESIRGWAWRDVARATRRIYAEAARRR